MEDCTKFQIKINQSKFAKRTSLSSCTVITLSKKEIHHDAQFFFRELHHSSIHWIWGDDKYLWECGSLIKKDCIPAITPFSVLRSVCNSSGTVQRKNFSAISVNTSLNGKAVWCKFVILPGPSMLSIKASLKDPRKHSPPFLWRLYCFSLLLRVRRVIFIWC